MSGVMMVLQTWKGLYAPPVLSIRSVHALFFVFLFSACRQDGVIEVARNDSLFERKSSAHTGISFSNDIVENERVNGILYEYLYNGGGVASADFNSDGLPDLFFVSNQGRNTLYLNQGNLRFRDVTKTSGVYERLKGFPTGATVADVNADGLVDIYLCRSGKYRDPSYRTNLLFINQGPNSDGIPSFREEGQKHGLDLAHYSTQASFFDYDRDGDLDMFLINHGPRIYKDDQLTELAKHPSPLQSEQLFQNNDGFFTNVSREAGLIDNGLSYGLGLAVGDLNNDQWPDVIVGHDFSQKDHLYLNQKDGTFLEVSEDATNHISYFSMGNDIADFNNDGWLDFMSLDMVGTSSYDIKTSMSGMDPERFYHLVDEGYHHQYMFNCLQLNQGIYQGVPRFSDVAQLAGVSNTDWSWSPLFFDADNDGFQDLFVSNGIKRDFRNNDFLRYKQGRFDDFFSKYKENTAANKREARKLTDELINRMPERPKPNFLFQNKGDLTFAAQHWLGEEENVTNGALYADLDLDGDLDLVLNNMDEEASIYENKANRNNFLQIALKGPKDNPFALGSRVYIKKSGTTQIREQYSSRGFQSAALGPLHVGLGRNTAVDSLVVRWPDGRQSVRTNVPANELVEISYVNADQESDHKISAPAPLVLEEQRLPFLHQENTFDDFAREGLLPHRMSRFGPALAVGDIDEDGTEEIFVGGAIGQSSVILKQNEDGEFNIVQSFLSEKKYEDVSAIFIDLDKDQDLDIYVVTGGNEYPAGASELNDRIYVNDGGGAFSLSTTIPLSGVSGGRVKPWDWDKDGDMDLLVTGRQIPGQYPFPASSYLLRNYSSDGRIVLKKEAWQGVGMVTDAAWLDINADGWDDLVMVGEWMAPVAYLNDRGKFADKPTDIGLSNELGWWFIVKAADMNNDGLDDLVIGNNGLNYKYKASPEEPFEIYAHDFDDSGDTDLVLSYSEHGEKVPLRGRQCSSQEMPFISDSFKTYQQFAAASMIDIYGRENLEKSLKYTSTNFASCLFINDGQGSFIKHRLPAEAQFSSLNAIHIEDLDQDGFKDLIVGGNMHTAEVETTRNDASFGTVLIGNGVGGFSVLPPVSSGLYLNGDVRSILPVVLEADRRGLVVARNNDFLKIIFY